MDTTLNISENSFYKQVLEFHCPSKFFCHIWALKSLVPNAHPDAQSSLEHCRLRTYKGQDYMFDTLFW